MQLFRGKLEKIWNGWEVRVLIEASLILQVILIIFGGRRKVTASLTVRMVVWSAYLVADSVACMALGNIAHILPEPKNALQTFWAPFLLLHLGGPDTITAFSLEDNELWLRHLLGLFLQVGVAFYVFLRTWSDTALTFIAIPIFVTGIIKYGERTFVLRSSSIEHFRDSLPTSGAPHQAEKTNPEDHYLVQAFFLFRRSAYLYANLIVDYLGQNDPVYSIIQSKKAADAFKLVEAELGFMYDVLFTKATIVYSRLGIFLRCISFLSSVSALIVFSVIIDIHAYPKADISFTYSLLVAAVFLEIYAFIVLMLSDWTKVWLIKQKKDGFVPSFLSKPSKRWSRSMGQYNLIDSWCKNESATFIGVLIDKLVDMKYRNLTWIRVSNDLQDDIFKQIRNIDKGQSLKQLLDRRGDYVLEKYSRDDCRWSTIDVEFDHSLLVWHIATDLCYYEDYETHKDDRNLQNSKALSDYMLYLLVFCPSMLQKGISHEIRYRDTSNAIKSVLTNKDLVEKSSIGKELDEKSSTRKKLVEKTPDDNRAVDTMSVLHLGCRLAKKLQEQNNSKWKMIRELWTEMLVYAASHCPWKEHGQQLGKGGELLTHVSLILAHFGLNTQYRTKDDSVVPDWK